MGAHSNRVVSVLFWLLVGYVACGCRKGSGNRIFFERLWRLDVLPTLEIDLSPDQASQLRSNPRQFVQATFRQDGTELQDVAIRLKGHRSMRPLDDKPSFKIRFDKYKKQKFHGAKTLTLNNMVEDPTMMREVLAYRLYRKLNVAAPRAAYVNVSVNGVPYGLYVLIETVDKAFLADNFKSDDGWLYEGEYGCDLDPADVDGFDRDSGSRDRRTLRHFAEWARMETPFQQKKNPLHTAAFVRYLAVSMFVGDFDGYRHSHN